MRVSERASEHEIHAPVVERIDRGLNMDDDTERMRGGGGVEEERQMCTRSSQRDVRSRWKGETLRVWESGGH